MSRLWRSLAKLDRWGNRLDLPLWAIAAVVAIGFLITGVHGHAHYLAMYIAIFGFVRVLVRGLYLYTNRTRPPLPRERTWHSRRPPPT